MAEKMYQSKPDPTDEEAMKIPHTIATPCRRHLALGLLSLIGLGAWVCWDSVGAIQRVFEKHLDIEKHHFSMVYSASAWPNIILCLVSGYLVDRFFGIRLGTVVYAGVGATGQFIFTMGVLYSHFIAILFGKLVFGIGMEAIFICLQFYAVYLFPEEQVSFITCILFSVIRVGSSISFWMAPPLYEFLLNYFDPTSALTGYFITTVLILLASTIFAVVLAFLTPPSRAPPDVTSDCPESDQSRQLLKKLPPQKEQSSIEALFNLLSFPAEFWLVCFINVAYTTSLYIIIPFTQDLFYKEHGMTESQANLVTSIHTILSAILAPPVGWTVDKLSSHLNAVFGIGLATNSLAYLIFMFTHWNPYIPMLILSVSYSLWTSLLTPIINRIVDQQQLATAFGMCQSIYNLMYSVNIMLAGTILQFSSFFYFHIFILGWITAGLIASVLLYIKANSRRKEELRTKIQSENF